MNTGASEWVSTDFKAGDVAIVSLNTVHMSTTNTSNFWRISCDTRWQPAHVLLVLLEVEVIDK